MPDALPATPTSSGPPGVAPPASDYLTPSTGETEALSAMTSSTIFSSSRYRGEASIRLSALLAAWAIFTQQFWWVVVATVVAGYYSANGQLYRFAAADLAQPSAREKAVSLVLAGGLLGGAYFGPLGATVGSAVGRQTGDILGTNDERIGEVQVIEIRAAHLSLATILKGKGVIKPRDHVRVLIVR